MFPSRLVNIHEDQSPTLQAQMTPPFIESAWKKGLGEDFEVRAIGMRESLASRSLREKKKGKSSIL